MTQEWDDILSEPMAQLQPDLPAVEGGWRAVRSIEEVSPRPQQPPLTLPDPDGMLSVRLPVQPEDATPASAPPPASLTGQLSLTWANRRRGRRNVEDAPEDNWPAWDPGPPAEAEVPPAPPLGLSWLRPLRSLVRLLTSEAGEEPVPLAPPSTGLVRDESAVPEPSRAGTPEESPELAPPRQGPQPLPVEAVVLPLTLAKRPAPTASAERRDSVSTEEPPASQMPASLPEAQMPDAPRRQESVLRRWLERRRPVEPPMPQESAHFHEHGSFAPREFRPAPMVTRREQVVAESHTEARQETEEATPEAPPVHREEGEPLPPVLRERMEKLFDVPLKEVRVFRNSTSHQAAHAHSADALAVGHDVHMASGRGNPSTPSGQALLAHELSHVAARIAGKSEPAHLEERRAQAIEHSIKSQPELAAVRPAATAPPPLQHRSQPRGLPAAPASPSSAASYSGGGFVGGGTAGSAPAVHRAPVGRIPAVADSVVSGGSGRSMSRSGESDGGPMDDNEPDRDEPGGVDRVVEAVMRRLRREGSLERERRGSFRSEIGG